MFSTFPLIILFIIQIVIIFIGILVNPLIILVVPIVLILCAWLIYNPGFSLLMLVITGIIKGFLITILPIFEYIDYTLLFSILVWIGIVRLLLIGEISIPKWSKSHIWYFILFSIILLISGFYTPSPNYGWQKIFRFFLFNTTMFITPFFIIKTISDSIKMVNWFKAILMILVIIMAVYIFYFLMISKDISLLIRASMLGANPIDVASFLAIGAGIILILMIYGRKISWFLYIPLLGIIITGLIMTGSRGPIISLIFGSFLYLALFERKRGIEILWPGVLIFLLLVITLSFLPENFTTRFVDYTTGDLVIKSSGVKRVSTIAMRLQYWQLSLSEWSNSIKSFIIGVGSGGFSSFYILRDYRFYPHNMFFEVLLELGLFGFSVFAIFWIKCFKSLISKAKQVNLSSVSAIWVISLFIRFFGAQFSGDINGNRIVWFFIAIAMATVYNENNLQKTDYVKNS